MCREVVVAFYETLSLRLPVRTEESHRDIREINGYLDRYSNRERQGKSQSVRFGPKCGVRIIDLTLLAYRQ